MRVEERVWEGLDPQNPKYPNQPDPTQIGA